MVTDHYIIYKNFPLLIMAFALCSIRPVRLDYIDGKNVVFECNVSQYCLSK